MIGYHIRLSTMYSGDVHDSPPVVLRVAMGAACLFGGVFMLVYLALASLAVPIIIVVAGLILSLYLITVVPTAASLALVTILYWGLLGGLALFLPF
jgi:hypothetical protein